MGKSDFAKDFNKLTHKISYNSELPYNEVGNDKIYKIGIWI